MILQPPHLDDLSRALREAHSARNKISPIDLSHLNQLICHTPEDMTATVQAGMLFHDFQAALARHQQWLPLDPPDAAQLTISQLIATNASGPRRFGHGNVRDHLIGIRVALADGRVIKAGGQVVKNVAGYDLCKLFVGSQDTLGIIVEAVFKLKPRPAAEKILQTTLPSVLDAEPFLNELFESNLTPVLVDLHNIHSRDRSLSPGPCRAVVGFEGSPQEVHYQVHLAQSLGLNTSAAVTYESDFLSLEASPIRQLSVLPSQLARTLSDLGPVPFVARAGNGSVRYRGGPEIPPARQPQSALHLMQRAKDTFDPHHILPDFPW